jgi:hypothetical protein
VLSKALQFHERTLKEEKLKYGWAEVPSRLFDTKAGTPLDPANVRRAMLRVLKLQGSPSISRRTVFVIPMCLFCTLSLTMEPATWIEQATCGLRISKTPNADNPNPQETTKENAADMGPDGAELSCRGSNVVAEPKDEAARLDPTA